MADITTQVVRDYLTQVQGQILTLDRLRKELHILPGTKAFDIVRNIMFQLAEQKVVRPLSRGEYKVVVQVQPVSVYGVDRERRPQFPLIFPKDEHGMEFDFAEKIIVREGDLVLIGGVKSKGKTTLCLGFLASNIDMNPVLMGNEYTQIVSDKETGKETYEPNPRFINRLDTIRDTDGIQWIGEDGQDRFTLLPVRDDYAEHVIKDRLNIIDWINLDGDKLYNIGKVLSGCKTNVGRGVIIAVLQKGEGMADPRGKQFARDFADVEIALDGFGDNEDEILLTLRGVKEKKSPIVGTMWGYRIVNNGTQIVNFREVKKCSACKGQGYKMGKECDLCLGKKYVDA